MNRLSLAGVAKKRGPLLICRVRYFSAMDEDAFFEWLKKIPSIAECKGVYDELHLHIKSKKISNRDLRELIAIFYRYKIEMSQLKVFLNKSNRQWFYEEPKGYWHEKVFELSNAG